jgi:DNA-binding CsgD family transcriptional regulator
MTLTPQETRVSLLWLQGHNHAEIARRLGISASGVGVHIHRVRCKLGLQDKNDVPLADALRKLLKLKPAKP